MAPFKVDDAVDFNIFGYITGISDDGDITVDVNFGENARMTLEFDSNGKFYLTQDEQTTLKLRGRTIKTKESVYQWAYTDHLGNLCKTDEFYTEDQTLIKDCQCVDVIERFLPDGSSIIGPIKNTEKRVDFLFETDEMEP